MNKRLVIGIILVAIFIFIAIFGNWIAPYPIRYQELTKYVDGKLQSPPYPPSYKHLLGTDRYGYDVLTKLFFGAKYTIITALLISFFRIIFGMPIGIFIGIKKRKKKKSLIATVWNVIPSFLIAFALLYPINMVRESTEISKYLLAVTVAIFAAIGLPSIISNFRERTQILMKRDYISAAKILGASNFRIMYKHIIPHIIETIVTMFVTEILLVLSLFGQLGIFNLFIGGTMMTYWPTSYYSNTFEWAGLIGQFRMSIYTSQWIVFAPIATFFLLIFSFQLLSWGLNQYYKEKVHNYPFI